MQCSGNSRGIGFNTLAWKFYFKRMEFQVAKTRWLVYEKVQILYLKMITFIKKEMYEMKGWIT